MSLIDYFYKGQEYGNHRYHGLLRDRIDNKSKQLLLDAAELDYDRQKRTHEANVQESLAKARDLAHQHDYSRDKRERMRPYDYAETATGHYANAVGNLDRGMEHEERMRYRAALSDIGLQTQMLQSTNVRDFEQQKKLVHDATKDYQFKTEVSKQQNNQIEEYTRGNRIESDNIVSAIELGVTKENSGAIQKHFQGEQTKKLELLGKETDNQLDNARLTQYKTQVNLKLAEFSRGDRKKAYQLLDDILADPKANAYMIAAASEKKQEMIQEDNLAKEVSEQRKQNMLPPQELIAEIEVNPSGIAKALGLEHIEIDKDGYHHVRLRDGRIAKFSNIAFKGFVLSQYGYRSDFYDSHNSKLEQIKAKPFNPFDIYMVNEIMRGGAYE